MAKTIIITSEAEKKIFIEAEEKIDQLIEETKSLDENIRLFYESTRRESRRFSRMRRMDFDIHAFTQKPDKRLQRLTIAEIEDLKDLREKIQQIITLIEQNKPIRVKEGFFPRLSIQQIYREANRIREIEENIIKNADEAKEWMDLFGISETDKIFKHLTERKKILSNLIDGLKRIYKFGLHAS